MLPNNNPICQRPITAVCSVMPKLSGADSWRPALPDGVEKEPRNWRHSNGIAPQLHSSWVTSYRRAPPGTGRGSRGRVACMFGNIANYSAFVKCWLPGVLPRLTCVVTSQSTCPAKSTPGWHCGAHEPTSASCQPAHARESQAQKTRSPASMRGLVLLAGGRSTGAVGRESPRQRIAGEQGKQEQTRKGRNRGGQGGEHHPDSRTAYRVVPFRRAWGVAMPGLKPQQP